MKNLLLLYLVIIFFLPKVFSQTVRFDEMIYANNQIQFKLPIVFDSMPQNLKAVNVVFYFDINKYKIVAYGGSAPIPFVSSPNGGRIDISWEDILVNPVYIVFSRLNAGCGSFLFDRNLSFILDSVGNPLIPAFAGEIICIAPDFKNFLFPNPSNGIFNLITDANIGSIEIFSMLGEKVYESSQVEKEINLTGKGSGIYLAKLINSNTVFFQKIIIF